MKITSKLKLWVAGHITTLTLMGGVAYWQFNALLAPLQQSALMWLLLGGMLLMAPLVATVFLVQSLAHRLQLVNEFANQMAALNLGHPSNDQGHDEISDLLCALDDMRHKLQSMLTNVRPSAEVVDTASEVGLLTQGSPVSCDQKAPLQDNVTTLEWVHTVPPLDTPLAVQENDNDLNESKSKYPPKSYFGRSSRRNIHLTRHA